MLNRPRELYSQLTLLRPDVINNFGEFGNRYCDPHEAAKGHTDWSGSDHLKELNFLMTKLVMIRRLKKDVLSELPDKQRHVMPVDVETDETSEADMSRLLEIISFLKSKTGKLSTEE